MFVVVIYLKTERPLTVIVATVLTLRIAATLQPDSKVVFVTVRHVRLHVLVELTEVTGNGFTQV